MDKSCSGLTQIQACTNADYFPFDSFLGDFAVSTASSSFPEAGGGPAWPLMSFSLSLTGATRRAAPLLQSSGIVRIDFRPVLYICALHAHRARPLRVFLLYRVDNRIFADSTRTAPFRASAEVLANYTFLHYAVTDRSRKNEIACIQ